MTVKSNPIRSLRDLLGPSGKRLSTQKLSALTGIPYPTLHSIDLGRAAFTPGVQQRLRGRGANWNPKTRTWTFTYNDKLPLTLELFSDYNRLGRGSTLFQQLSNRAASVHAIALLQGVSPKDYLTCLMRIQDFLSQLRNEYKVSLEDKILSEIWPKVEYQELDSGARVLVKRYTMEYPPDPDEIYNLTHLQKTAEKYDDGESFQKLPVASKPAA